MRLTPTPAFTFLSFVLGSGIIACAAEQACAPPSGFRDAPHPVIAGAQELVAHTEQVEIDRSFPIVSAAMNMPLKQALRGSGSLPGVAGDYMLTKGEFGTPGSRHIVCLTDGTTVEEEALERDGTSTSGHFRYIVWNYGTPKARPVQYGVGEFRTVQIDASHTRVTWTYSFRLKDDVFPGSMGALGRWLFRIAFLDRDYATMMRSVLRGYKQAAEASPALASVLSSP